MDIKKVIAVGKVISTGSNVSCHVATVLFNVEDNKHIMSCFSITYYHCKSVSALADFIINELDFSNTDVVINGDGLGINLCQYIVDAGVDFNKLNWLKPCFKAKFRERFISTKSRCCHFLQSIIDSGYLGVIGEFEFKKELDVNAKIKAWFVGTDALIAETLAMAFYDESMDVFVVMPEANRKPRMLHFEITL